MLHASVFKDTATTEIYTLSLHDALPIVLTEEEQALLRWPAAPRSLRAARWSEADTVLVDEEAGLLERTAGYGHVDRKSTRLNSSHANISYAVFCLQKTQLR